MIARGTRAGCGSRRLGSSVPSGSEPPSALGRAASPGNPGWLPPRAPSGARAATPKGREEARLLRSGRRPGRASTMVFTCLMMLRLSQIYARADGATGIKSINICAPLFRARNIRSAVLTFLAEDVQGKPSLMALACRSLIRSAGAVCSLPRQEKTRPLGRVSPGRDHERLTPGWSLRCLRHRSSCQPACRHLQSHPRRGSQNRPAFSAGR